MPIIFYIARLSLKKDGVALHLRYQVMFSSLFYVVFMECPKYKHQLLSFDFIISTTNWNSKTPQVAYETVIELCFLLFRAGLGTQSV